MHTMQAVQGVPPMQYVNAKARGDEWPPKYWKVGIGREGDYPLIA